MHETEILPHYELIFYVINHTLSGTQFQKIIQNSFPGLLTKTPTKYISTEVETQ